MAATSSPGANAHAEPGPTVPGPPSPASVDASPWRHDGTLIVPVLMLLAPVMFAGLVWLTSLVASSAGAFDNIGAAGLGFAFLIGMTFLFGAAPLSLLGYVWLCNALIRTGSDMSVRTLWAVRASVAVGAVGLLAIGGRCAMFGFEGMASVPGIAVPVLAIGSLIVGVTAIGTRALISPAQPPRFWWVVSALIFTLVVGGTYALQRGEANAFYAKQSAIVAAARDSARPQTRDELAERIVAVLDSSKSPQTEDTTPTVGAKLEALWHPGPVENSLYFSSTPGEPALGLREEERGSHAEYIEGRLPAFRADPSAESTGRLGQVREGDTFVVRWGKEVPLSAIDRWSRDLLSFWNMSRWVGTGFRDGEPLFPKGRFYELAVFRVRDTHEEPFLTLYVVNDRGKWWLVGIRNPYESQVE